MDDDLPIIPFIIKKPSIEIGKSKPSIIKKPSIEIGKSKSTIIKKPSIEIGKSKPSIIKKPSIKICKYKPSIIKKLSINISNRHRVVKKSPINVIDITNNNNYDLYNGIQIWSVTPLVMHTANTNHEFLDKIIMNIPANKKVYLLLSINGPMDYSSWYSDILKKYLSLHNVRVIFLLNDMSQYFLLNECSSDLEPKGILCSKNSFIDERIFYIDYNISKIIDVIMISQLKQFKNIEYAENIKNIFIATYGNKNITLKDNYPSMIHAKTNDKFMNSTEINNIINSSKLGMILSMREGQNRATVEYSLCGIPVITTKNATGGRHLFYNKYTKFVDLDKEYIEKMVEEVKNDSVDREYIRNNTLIILEEHRQRFKELIQNITGNNISYSHILDYSFFISFSNIQALKTI